MANSPFASRNSDTNKDHADPMMDRVAATQRETIDRIADEANDVRRGVRGVTATAAATAKRAQNRLVETAGEKLRNARSQIERNPLATVAIAFVSGVLLSRWIRR